MIIDEQLDFTNLVAGHSCSCHECLRFVEASPGPNGLSIVYCLGGTFDICRLVDLKIGCAWFELKEVES